MTKVEIKLNDGVIRNVNIDNYNAHAIAEDLNNPDKHMMAIGDVVVQRYSVVRIVPIDLNEEPKNDTE